MLYFTSDEKRTDFENEWMQLTEFLRSNGRMKLPKGTIERWKADIEAVKKELEKRYAIYGG